MVIVALKKVKGGYVFPSETEEPGSIGYFVFGTEKPKILSCKSIYTFVSEYIPKDENGILLDKDDIGRYKDAPSIYRNVASHTITASPISDTLYKAQLEVPYSDESNKQLLNPVFGIIEVDEKYVGKRAVLSADIKWQVVVPSEWNKEYTSTNTKTKSVKDRFVSTHQKINIVEHETTTVTLTLTAGDYEDVVSMDSAWLIGQTGWLQGVELSEGSYFTFNNLTFYYETDEEDGYRSTMKDPVLVDYTPTPLVPPIHVEICKWTGSEGNGIMLVDTTTKAVVLTIGTDYSDDYYPSAIATFDPRHSVHNNVLDDIEVKRLSQDTVSILSKSKGEALEFITSELEADGFFYAEYNRVEYLGDGKYKMLPYHGRIANNPTAIKQEMDNTYQTLIRLFHEKPWKYKPENNND